MINTNSIKMSINKKLNKIMNEKKTKRSKVFSLMLNTFFILSILICLASGQAAGALDLFYTGDVEIYSMYTIINAENTHAQITVDYTLFQQLPSEYGKDRGTYVNLTFSEYDMDDVNVLIDGKEFTNPVYFTPGEVKEVHITYTQDIKGTTLKSIDVNPILLFDGMRNSKRVSLYNLKLLVPSGINKLITSSIEYDSTSSANRTSYYWNKKNVYPTSLNVKWSTIDADISIKKSVLTDIIKTDGVMIVEVLVENKGNKDARDVVLSDTILLSDFEPIEPKEDFVYEDAIVATWKKEIDILKAGERKTFTYQIKLKNPAVSTLKPIIAIIDGSLIGVSNDVIIKDKICGDKICMHNETYENCPQDCPVGKDNYCDPKEDRKCDPDCDPRNDIDCTKDTDNDGIIDILDNCPLVNNPDKADSDADGVGDACDNCPNKYNPDQKDSDNDGIGGACESEIPWWLVILIIILILIMILVLWKKTGYWQWIVIGIIILIIILIFMLWKIYSGL